MPKKPHIPQTPEELTAEYFTDAIGDGHRVTAVSTAAIGTDVGFMGEVYRCELRWDDGAAARPASVIVKVPSTRTENRALGEALRSYEREIDVYRLLRDDLSIPMPLHHHSVMDPNPAPWLERPILFLFDKLPTKVVGKFANALMKLSEKNLRRYLLVIEDIPDARPPVQQEGGSLDDSRRALEILADFHAANWMRTEALETVPTLYLLDGTPKVLQAGYIRNKGVISTRFAEVAPAHVEEQLDRFQERYRELTGHLTSAPQTVQHGDYRLDNLLFRPDGEVCVIDYQGLGWGRAGFDVAYFITTTLSPEHKPDEESLMRGYHERLVAGGVTDYSYDDLVRDTQLSKLLMAHRFVSGRDMVDTEVASSEATLLDVFAARVFGWLDPDVL